MHKLNRGARAAVTLVTAVRSNLAETELSNAQQLTALMRDIVAESSSQELVATMYALTVMAANPMNNEELSDFALSVSRSL